MTTKTWQFPSSSNPIISYLTTLAENGQISCTCKGWTMKRAGRPRECTHITKLIGDHGWTRTIIGDLVHVAGDLTQVIQSAPATEPGDEFRAPAAMLASGMVEGKYGHLEGAAFDARFQASEWVLEVKLDGHRVLVVKRGAVVRAWSRSGHGSAALSRELPQNVKDGVGQLPDGTYDGELVASVDGTLLTGKSWDASRVDVPKVLVLFDALEVQGIPLHEEPWTNRHEVLEMACQVAGHEAVRVVPCYPPTWASVQAIWAQGGEGAILKRRASVYRPGTRSADWVKVKQLESHTVTIVGFEAGSFGPHSVVLVRFDDGALSRVKTKNNDWLRQFAACAQRYIGSRMVLECQLRTKGGSPRHPMAKRLELDHVAGDGE